ncbi:MULTISPECIES: FecR family protein [unclassified Chitinophaga]|uniref:FecR family protein n=1 Tax=unclassified Chitinophaga TaxID=2619133 RepID=UPI00301028FA
MTPSRLQYLLDRYLNGTATEAEQAEYDHWYEQQQVPEINAFTSAERSEMYAVIATRIREKRRVVYLRRAAAVAAAVVIAAGALWMFNTTLPPARKVAVKQAVLQPDTTAIANTSGKQQILHLPDGSQVILYKDAEIRFAAPFGTKNRIVLLRGKGYFNVTANAPKPFTVWSEGVSTTALGTSFTISSKQKEVNVILHTGKVMVKTNAQVRYLTPGQSLVCNAATGIARLQPIPEKTLVTPKIDFGSLRGFTATFDQAPLSNVFDTIARGYHVNIQLKAAAFNNIAFSGVIRDTDSLLQVLHRIAMLHDLKITSTNTGYRIEKNH